MNKKKLLQIMTETALTSTGNTFKNTYRFYDPPIIGFADADDQLFQEMKKDEIIGDIYRLPKEWLPEATTVISYFLPFTTEVRHSNHEPGLASIEWLHARFPGEEFNNQMRRIVIKELENAGGKALAPMLEPEMVIDYNIYASNWSERHAAYIAGLGTFSLNAALITEKGMSGRFGSVITNLKFDPTPRSYSHPFAHCPQTNDGKCGACIQRCPVNAITKEGKDKAKCHYYLFTDNPLQDTNKEFGYPYSACGKCQSNVPCESSIPGERFYPKSNS
ncbi:MAG: epoxyqueuosine reductase [Clostridiales bacterium]|jgi:epoxyqueuosine reductase QueG|nr:epoxyqueuosine reductase [Clostridiales bacterium]